MYLLLTLCMLGNFQGLIFSKIIFDKKPSVSYSFNPDQALHFIRPDLGQNCFHRLTADDSCGQRVNGVYYILFEV